jgi:RNA recognition motif-containing protein
MELMITVSESSLPNMEKSLKVPCSLLHLHWLYFLLTSYASTCLTRIIVDRESGRSRGFGFVTYTS